MASRFTNVYQFKITLKDSKPPIWRRIQVPETYSFWELHLAIQDAMGWEHAHLHNFRVTSPKSGVETSIGIIREPGLLLGHKVKLSQFLQQEKDKALYIYDFGDDWEHTVVLEKILPRQAQQDYPVCLAGKRACPPEDCGGIWGFARMLEILKDPAEADYEGEYEEYLDWLGGDYDPAYFDPGEVVFLNPKHVEIPIID